MKRSATDEVSNLNKRPKIETEKLISDIPSEVVGLILHFSVEQSRSCQDFFSFGGTSKGYNILSNQYSKSLFNRIIMPYCDSNIDGKFLAQSRLASIFKYHTFKEAALLYFCAKMCQKKSLYYDLSISFLNYFKLEVIKINENFEDFFLKNKSFGDESSVEWRILAKKLELIVGTKTIAANPSSPLLEFIFFIKKNAMKELFSSKINSFIMRIIQLIDHNIDNDEVWTSLAVLADFCDEGVWGEEAGFYKASHSYVRELLNIIFKNKEADLYIKIKATIIAYYTFGSDDIIWQQFSIVSMLEEKMGTNPIEDSLNDYMDESDPLAKAYIIESIYNFILKEGDAEKIKEVFSDSSNNIVNIFIAVKEVIDYYKKNEAANTQFWEEAPRGLLAITNKLKSLGLIMPTTEEFELIKVLQKIDDDEEEYPKSFARN